MQKEPIIFMSALGATGYAVFRGHKVNESC